MKTPLRYQITEFDCGSVSLLNCLIYLFDRENIPAELIKAISTYTLDCYDEHGNLGQHGTSREAVKFLSHWIMDFCQNKKFNLSCKYLHGKSVTIDAIKSCLNKGGCVNLRSYLDGEHYVMISKIDENFVYIFDPYYLKKNQYKDDDIEILNRQFDYNRKVKLTRFCSVEVLDFALGPVSKREIVLFNKNL